jgi:hypothetical protein
MKRECGQNGWWYSVNIGALIVSWSLRIRKRLVIRGVAGSRKATN